MSLPALATPVWSTSLMFPRSKSSRASPHLLHPVIPTGRNVCVWAWPLICPISFWPCRVDCRSEIHTDDFKGGVREPLETDLTKHTWRWQPQACGQSSVGSLNQRHSKANSKAQNPKTKLQQWFPCSKQSTNSISIQNSSGSYLTLCKHHKLRWKDKVLQLLMVATVSQNGVKS